MSQTDRNGVTNDPTSPPAFLNWRGQWLTATEYRVYDAFYNTGSSYIVTSLHISGNFLTDLASGFFELMVAAPDASAISYAGGTGMSATDVEAAIDELANEKMNLTGGTVTGDITMSAASIIEAEGAAVASASSTNIWATDGNTRHITGTTTINDFATAPQAGARMKVIFDGVLTLTQSANLNLNGGGSNITTAADDWAEVYADTTTQMDVTVHRKSGASIVSTASSVIQPITASVGASALTLTINPTKLDFRSATLTSGTVTSRTISSAISMTVSSGSTLGTTNAVASRIAVLAIDNAGTIEVACVNIAGGTDLSETGLISTTAEGGAGAADSATTIYSTTARTNVAYRVVGYVDSTQATAGTWATAPSTIQGAGGNSMSSLFGLGAGQTWQNMTASRANNVSYLNTTGKPIFVSIYCTVGASSTGTLTIGGVQVNARFNNLGDRGDSDWFGGVVPHGATYITTGISLSTWAELR